MFRTRISSRPAACVGLPSWSPKETGLVGSHQWRLFFTDASSAEARPRSAWHDLPLHPFPSDASQLTFVCEIPRGTRAKLELCKEEPHNPLAQDVHRGREGKPLRFFTYGDMPFHYGFAPRTWEDPLTVDSATHCAGDGDPIDLVHLVSKSVCVGEIAAVRVLGVLGLIDEGETDWKVLTSAGEEYGSLQDVPRELKDTIVRWFTEYKTTDGKKRNELAFDGEIKGVEEALEVIRNGAAQYQALIEGKAKNPGYWL